MNQLSRVLKLPIVGLVVESVEAKPLNHVNPLLQDKTYAGDRFDGHCE